MHQIGKYRQGERCICRYSDDSQGNPFINQDIYLIGLYVISVPQLVSHSMTHPATTSKLPRSRFCSSSGEKLLLACLPNLIVTYRITPFRGYSRRCLRLSRPYRDLTIISIMYLNNARIDYYLSVRPAFLIVHCQYNPCASKSPRDNKF